MKDISIKDLANLVVSEVPEADSRIEKLFDWHFQRDTMISKWILGVAASLGVSILAAFFKADISPNWWQTCLLVALPMATSSYGIFRIIHMRSIHRQFFAALRIYNDLKRIKPFISRYRETLGHGRIS